MRTRRALAAPSRSRRTPSAFSAARRALSGWRLRANARTAAESAAGPLRGFVLAQGPFCSCAVPFLLCASASSASPSCAQKSANVAGKAVAGDDVNGRGAAAAAEADADDCAGGTLGSGGDDAGVRADAVPITRSAPADEAADTGTGRACAIVFFVLFVLFVVGVARLLDLHDVVAALLRRQLAHRLQHHLRAVQHSTNHTPARIRTSRPLTTRTSTLRGAAGCAGADTDDVWPTSAARAAAAAAAGEWPAGADAGAGAAAGGAGTVAFSFDFFDDRGPCAAALPNSASLVSCGR